MAESATLRGGENKSEKKDSGCKRYSFVRVRDRMLVCKKERCREG